MSDIIFSVNAVFPLILIACIGYFFKRIGLIKKELAGGMNRLVFRLFLPCMLFLNIYKIESFSASDLHYVWYTLGITALLFLVAIPLTRMVTKDGNQRGVMVQASFRSNFALVGIPLASALFGESGASVATLLSAFLIPTYNCLAVVCLTVFTDRDKKSINLSRIFTDIVKNPLIQSIALGLLALLVRRLLGSLEIDFRFDRDIPFLYKTVDSISKVATPLSLVVLGAQFEFTAVSALKKQILFGVIARGAVVPTVGLGVAYLLGCFSGAHFAAFVAAFATPIAVSSVPMAQEMGADARLAGQLVVWTTLISALSLFVCATVLRALGVF